MPQLTAEEARLRFRYDPETGRLFSRADPNHEYKSRNDHGHIVLRCGEEVLSAHRVIFLMETGYWPLWECFHANGDGSDNRWCNLRDGYAALGRAPAGTVARPAPGVQKSKKREAYLAFVNWRRHRYYVGTYPTIAQAIESQRAKIAALEASPQPTWLRLRPNMEKSASIATARKNS